MVSKNSVLATMALFFASSVSAWAQTDGARMHAVADDVLHRCGNETAAAISRTWSAIDQDADASDSAAELSDSQTLVRLTDKCVQNLEPGSPAAFFIEGLKLYAQHTIAGSLDRDDSRRTSATLNAFFTARHLCQNKHVSEKVFPYKDRSLTIIGSLWGPSLLYSELHMQPTSDLTAPNCLRALTQ
jgi:hypothetical protein